MNLRSSFFSTTLFTPEQLEFWEMSLRMADEKVRPLGAKLDREGGDTTRIIKEFFDAGFFNCYIPEEYGGLGLGMTELTLATEAISSGCAGLALSFAAGALGAFPIFLDGSDEQKKRWLSMIASGEAIAAFALTEPDAGSDAVSIQTRAVKNGNDYIINGTKQFITGAGLAKIYSVLTITDPDKGAKGATMFVVEEGTPGFKLGKKEDKFGIRASQTRQLIFEDCRVPATNIISGLGQGFRVVLNTLNRTRIGIGAQGLGITLAALEESIKYTKEREQFGKPLIANQHIQMELAQLHARYELARLHCYTLCRAYDEGIRHPGMSNASSISKFICSQLAKDAADKALQFAGGNGYMREYPFEKLVRDAAITTIYEGANEVLISNVGKALAR